MTFGQILRNLIEIREITQKQLAKDLHISESTLGNYVRDFRVPDFNTLKLLAEYFSVSTDYLLGHKTDNNISSTDDKILRVVQSLSVEQKELYLEMGRAFIRHNQKTNTTST